MKQSEIHSGLDYAVHSYGRSVKGIHQPRNLVKARVIKVGVRTSTYSKYVDGSVVSYYGQKDSKPRKQRVDSEGEFILREERIPIKNGAIFCRWSEYEKMYAEEAAKKKQKEEEARKEIELEESAENRVKAALGGFGLIEGEDYTLQYGSISFRLADFQKLVDQIEIFMGIKRP